MTYKKEAKQYFLQLFFSCGFRPGLRVSGVDDYLLFPPVVFFDSIHL